MQLSLAFKALADDSRLKLLYVLRDGSFNVQELTFILGLSQPTISHHLKILERCGMVACQKEGTWAYYKLRPENGRARNGRPALPGPKLVSQALSLLDIDDWEEAGDLLNERREETLTKRSSGSLQFFNTVAPRWEQVRSEALGGALSAERLRPYVPPAATFADLGCGSGITLASLLPRKGRTFGIDYSVEMLEEAKRAVNSKYPEVELLHGSLESLPLEDDSVDVALCHMVLHHTAEPSRTFSEVSRVVKSLGTLLVVELYPHTDETMRTEYADVWLGLDPDTLAEWLGRAGFSPQPLVDLGGEKRAYLLPAVRSQRKE